ncbi:hypothetical protein OSTOST_20049 [Ostertagia ostertagi]
MESKLLEDEIKPSIKSTVQALRLIPLQFSSGIVFSQYKPDCVDPMQMFFPIDAYAQTIQLNVVGFNKTVKVYDGAECDQGWDEVQQYCIRFVIPPYTYSDAKQFCHDSGGSIIDDLSETKHNYLLGLNSDLDFWLGLANPNNTGYVWDGPDGTPPLPLSNPTYWMGNKQPDYDATKECVYWKASENAAVNTWAKRPVMARVVSRSAIGITNNL